MCGGDGGECRNQPVRSRTCYEGAQLARDADDADFPAYRVDAIASKLCSHSGVPSAVVGSTLWEQSLLARGR